MNSEVRSDLTADLRAVRLDAPVADRRAKAKMILRRVLARRLGIEPGDVVIRVAAGGKPYADGCAFSISHSGPWLVIATGAVELGIDVEFKSRPPQRALELAERFFHPDDAERLRARCGAEAFLRQWVAKEASLKAAGVGIGGYLHKARCVFDGDAVAAVRWDGEHYSIREFQLTDGTPGALAWRGTSAMKVVWREPGSIS